MSTSAATFYKIAKRVSELQSQGRSIISLNIGHTALPPPQLAIDQLHLVSGAEPSSYGHPAGMFELREVISKREGVSTDNIVVGSDSNFLLFALIKKKKKRGQKLSFPEPYWPAYPLICEEVGISHQVIPTTIEEKWQIDLKKIPTKSSILLCNPQNPTSVSYSRESLSEISKRCREQNSFLVIDEAYRGLAFTPISPPEEAIRIRSFSKEFNMESWRLGYMVAPAEICNEVISYIQITNTCTPTILQRAGIPCINAADQITSNNREIWFERLNTLQEQLLQNGFHFCRSEAAMYSFATHPKITNSDAFCEKLIEHGVALAPGSAFGNFKKFVRISASANPTQLKEAVSIMVRVLNE